MVVAGGKGEKRPDVAGKAKGMAVVDGGRGRESSGGGQSGEKNKFGRLGKGLKQE